MQNHSFFHINLSQDFREFLLFSFVVCLFIFFVFITPTLIIKQIYLTSESSDTQLNIIQEHFVETTKVSAIAKQDKLSHIKNTDSWHY